MIRVFAILAVIVCTTAPVYAEDATLPPEELPPDAEVKTEEKTAKSDTPPAESTVPPTQAPTIFDGKPQSPSDPWFSLQKETTPEPAPSAKDFEVRQNGNNLELMTPYGRKIIFGDTSLNGARDYKFSIPLDQLRPPQEKKVEAPKKERDINSVEEEAKRTPLLAKPTPTEAPVAAVPPRVVVEYDYSDRLVLEANRLFNRRKFYEAAITVEELLTKRPDYPRGWVMKGSLMYVQGHRDLAKQAWLRALELDPNNSEVRQFLGRLK